ncbi:MAG TPA: hypothetical protein VM819_08800 [Vicinamibacterales bacterium]|jgi:hypothetical protein|nr:hypothetical protein [Vicinamibacterales bacterium]
MDKLAIQLALHGAVVLVVSLCAGLMTYRAILNEERAAAWHLAHAGGTARGVMLMALAAIVRLPALPLRELSLVAWLLIFFTWTSVFAMVIAAASGQRGLGFRGSITNKLVFVLYLVGGVAVFPACVALIAGLLRAL